MAVSLNSFTPNTQIESAKVNSNFSGLSAQIRPTFTFTVRGSLVVDTNVTDALIVPLDLTIEKVYAYLKTAPDGADIIVDINKNGTTIWSTQANRLTVSDGNQTGNTSVFNTTSLSEADILTLDVDQVGSTTAGSDLTIALKCS